MERYLEELANAKLCHFKDWPNQQIPPVCSGVYTVYDSSDHLIYVGMAGANLTRSRTLEKQQAGKQSGLYDRLRSHASGYRSGDQFNVYIGDLYVLKRLSRDQIEAISCGNESFDTHIKTFIHEHLSYRYVIVPNTIVRQIESEIQRVGLNGKRPAINAKG